jgi:hypothetical protein
VKCGVYGQNCRIPLRKNSENPLVQNYVDWQVNPYFLQVNREAANLDGGSGGC